MPENIYDMAHGLAAAIRRGEEYSEYSRLREAAYGDETNRALLDEYKRLQYRMQLGAASGNPMDGEDVERLTRIASLLQFNPETGALLVAEFRLQRLLADIYKILAEAAGINLDALAGQ